MAEVNYKASTSNNGEEDLEASVEIIDPKIVNSYSESNDEEEEEGEDNTNTEESNRPSDALWRQQRLPAWQPILTADTVLPAFFLLGIALIPIGVGLLLSSNYVTEISWDYTECMASNGRTKCMDIIRRKRIRHQKCVCYHNFTIDEDISAPVFFYYGLDNYYQNHRRYAVSRDDYQLAGRSFNKKNSDCQPFDKINGTFIAPCGAIANSLFNDTFQLYYQSERINLKQTHIAWPTDKKYKFNKPSEGYHSYTKPPYWQKHVDDLDTRDPNNNGYHNEHLIVWMRTAALPTFRKLWGRVDHDQNILWRTSLPKGKYQLKIDYNYPVVFDTYKATKYVIISNTSWLGGKNSFLGYAYIVVGGICLLLWAGFLLLVKKYGQKPKDIVDIGPKTKFTFTLKKKIVTSDESTQPLRSQTTVTFS